MTKPTIGVKDWAKKKGGDMTDEEKKSQPKAGRPRAGKKWCCCGVILVVLLIAVGVYWIQSKSPSDEVKFAPPRNYNLSNPSAEAQKRNIDCKKIIIYKNTPAKQNYNLLCQNLYQTSADDLYAKITGQKYDRIIVFGERVIFDANPQVISSRQISDKFYNIAKFTDQVTLPKLMSFYGVANLDYIDTNFSPFPAFTYEFESKEEFTKLCKSSTASGCALMHFWSVLDESVFTRKADWIDQHFLSKDNMDSVSWKTKWPENCYTDTVLMHETGHLLIQAHAFTVIGRSISAWYYIPSWFNEQQAGLAEIYGQNEVCGTGTLADFNVRVNGKDLPKDLVYFNSLYPAISLSQTYPRDNECELGMLSSFYRYLAKGDINTTYPAFMIAFRDAMEVNSDFRDDQTFLNFLKDLHHNDSAEMDFLRSHKCSV